MNEDIKYTNLKEMASTPAERAENDGFIGVADYRINPVTFKDGKRGIMLRVKDYGGVYYSTCSPVMVKSFIEAVMALKDAPTIIYVEERISKKSGNPYTVICPVHPVVQ